jgi:hypothetical protein
MKNKILIGLFSLMFAMSAQASLSVFQTYTGNVGLSTDGFGSTSNSGTLTANVPAGATILNAYLYTATYFNNATPTTVSLAGNAITFAGANGVNPAIPAASFRADVTSIVAGIIDPTNTGSAGGAFNFAINEGANGGDINGEALVVVYQEASLATSTVAILDGFSATTGDTATITYANPLDPTAAGFMAEMRLGISHSCCNQSSNVTVNGTLITQNAGNADDGSVANGALLTMGGDNDAYSGFLPTYADDHERYNLAPQINLGDTAITIRTNNPTNDDDIFLATFWTSGEGTVTTDLPEPATLLLMGMGLAGLGFARRRRS